MVEIGKQGRSRSVVYTVGTSKVAILIYKYLLLEATKRRRGHLGT